MDSKYATRAIVIENGKILLDGSLKRCCLTKICALGLKTPYLLRSQEIRHEPEGSDTKTHMIKYAEKAHGCTRQTKGQDTLDRVHLKRAACQQRALPQSAAAPPAWVYHARVSVYTALKELKVLWPFIIFPILLHGIDDPGKVLMDLSSLT